MLVAIAIKSPFACHSRIVIWNFLRKSKLHAIHPSQHRFICVSYERTLETGVGTMLSKSAHSLTTLFSHTTRIIFLNWDIGHPSYRSPVYRYSITTTCLISIAASSPISDASYSIGGGRQVHVKNTNHQRLVRKIFRDKMSSMFQDKHLALERSIRSTTTSSSSTSLESSTSSTFLRQLERQKLGFRSGWSGIRTEKSISVRNLSWKSVLNTSDKQAWKS